MNRQRTKILLAALVLFGAQPLQASSQTQQPTTVDQQSIDPHTTITLKPSAFPELPRVIRRYLDANHLGILEVSGSPASRNVVRGSFVGGKHQDWAIVASRDGMSEIYVFRGGSTSHVDRLARGTDDDTRTISVVGAEKLSAQYRPCEGSGLPSRLDHDGISDALGGTTSKIWYFDNGNWIQLCGLN